MGFEVLYLGITDKQSENICAHSGTDRCLKSAAAGGLSRSYCDLSIKEKMLSTSLIISYGFPSNTNSDVWYRDIKFKNSIKHLSFRHSQCDPQQGDLNHFHTKTKTLWQN